VYGDNGTQLAKSPGLQGMSGRAREEEAASEYGYTGTL